MATDFVGLSKSDLRHFMGAAYSSLASSEGSNSSGNPLNSFGLSSSEKEVLLPPGNNNRILSHISIEGSEKPITINEDGVDCLSNDEVDKQGPIHIAYRQTHIMTLVAGEDGVARLITRDMIGPSKQH